MKKITVYTTDQCAYCALVKKYYTLKGIDYEVVNLSEQPERRQEAINLSGAMTVPITTNGQETVVGWNPARLIQLAA